MDPSKSRPDTLPFTEAETGQAGTEVALSLPRDIGNLSPGTVVFHHTKVKYIPVFAQRSPTDTRDQGSQADPQTCTHDSTNKQTNREISNTSSKEDAIVEECPAEDCSREEIIKFNLEQHLIYISHCIKPEDLILYLHCFSEEQKSDILSEKNLIKASRKALEMLLHDVEDPGRFVELRDALFENDGYPKIVRILDGEYNPEDQHCVKVVELFTPKIIERLEPSELLPHLLQKGVFKQMDVEEIRAEEKNHGKMRAACVLLMYLPRRTVDWFRCFLSALIDCVLEDIAEMLDADMFKDIKLQKSNLQSRGISSIQNANKSKPTKPKIAPKLKFKRLPCKRDDNTSEVKGCCISNTSTQSKEMGKTDNSRNVDVTKGDQDEVIYSRISKTNEETLENSEDEVIYSEFSDEKIDYLTDNQTEREEIDKSMAVFDAKILWPDKKRGKNQILLKSISKDETDVTTWSRRRRFWKRKAMEKFKKLFSQISSSKNKSKSAMSNVSKILSSKDTPCKQHITQVRFKPLYGKKPVNSNVKMATNESTYTTKPDSYCSHLNGKTTSGEITNTLVAVSNRTHRNNQTLSNEMTHESEPSICSKKFQKCAICKMACGRSIFVLKGSLVDLSVDVMVNTTDNHLSFTTGLAETISEKGGERIRAACHKYIQSQRSIDEGEIFISEAGDLPAKHVMHINSPIWRGGNEGEDKLLKQAVMNVMLQASVKKAQTIALPAISCGVSGFPKKTAAELIVRAVRNFFREEPESSLRHVYIVDIYSQTARRFHEALCNVFSDDAKCVIEEIQES